MATTVSSAWTKPGAWALDSEEQEAMESLPKHHHNNNNNNNNNNDSLEFPSLTDAVKSKPSKKKKSQQTLSLAEFTTGKLVTHGSAKAAPPTTKGLTHDEILLLPTGPRERTAEELERSSSRLGGGFQSYGGGHRSRISNGDDSGSGSRWGSSRVSSDEDRPRSGFNRDSAPSRADEIDDWGAAKKSGPAMPGFERRERGGFFDSQSRADESDSWLSNKSYGTSSESRRVGGGFEGFREKKGGFEMFQKEAVNGGVEADSWGKKREEGSGRPRLMLQPRKLPVSNGEQQQQQQLGSGTRSKGSSPFGEARPREEVLAEKGQDWKKIDEQLESMKIKEIGPAAPVSGDGALFGKKSFGSGNERANLPEDRTERVWRKADSTDVNPSSQKVDNGEAEN